MPERTHHYELELEWQGNRGSGTSSYRDYDRTHEVRAHGGAAPAKPPLAGSADPAFRGEGDRWSPEELLVAALAQCHMLWYLHLAAVNGVVVTAYTDTPLGKMHEEPDGAGQFTEVVLRPVVTVADPAMAERAQTIHDEAHAKCFVARSVNFPVRHEPAVGTAGRSA